MDGPPRVLGVQCTALFGKPERKPIGEYLYIILPTAVRALADIVLLLILADKLLEEFSQLFMFVLFGLFFVLYTAASRK